MACALQFMLLISTLVFMTIGSPVLSSLDSSVCQKGPTAWCKDTETAAFCGVLALCKLQWSTNDVKGNAVQPDKKLEFQPMTTDIETKDKIHGDASPVTVTLYFESLCPGCKEVIMNQLYPTFQKLKGTGVLKVDLVPYGNARQQYYGGSWMFTCQHGPAECTGNVMEACAIHYMADDEKYVPFVHCLETYGPTEVNGRYCASLLGFDFNAIASCMYGAEGNSLEHEMGVKTESLNPPHQYVPWLTLNGVHTDQIQNSLSSNMLATVCSTYSGTKPAACVRDTAVPLMTCHKDA